MRFVLRQSLESSQSRAAEGTKQGSALFYFRRLIDLSFLGQGVFIFSAKKYSKLALQDAGNHFDIGFSRDWVLAEFSRNWPIFSQQQRCWLKLRQAIEPVVVDFKSDYRMSWCLLNRAIGNSNHVLLSVAGNNLSLQLRALACGVLKRLFCFIQMPRRLIGYIQMATHKTH